MAYGQPMLQLYTSDPTIPGSNPVGYVITDDNRAALQISYERLEESSRMADGTMRRFITANKKKVSTSWDTIPAAGGRNFTSDSNLSGAFLKSFFEENVYNPIWIKLTYSEEAWRFANSQSAVSNYGQTNLSYNTTTENTGVPSEFMIETIGTSVVSASTATGFIITKVPHNITPGSEIYIRGVDQIFNGTWITDSVFSSSAISAIYNQTVASANPSIYLRLESTTITDSSSSSATLNSGGRITSAAGTSSAVGLISNTVIAASDAYTYVTSSALASSSAKVGGEVWIKGDSSASLTGINIIRKLPSNLVANYGFNTNLDGWSASTASSVTNTISVSRNTLIKLSGDASMFVGINGLPSYAGSITYSSMSVSSSSPYFVSAYIYPKIVFSSSAAYTAAIIWKNGSGTIISSSVGASTVLSAVGWNKISASGNAPATAVTADIVFTHTSTNTQAFYIDNVLFEQATVANDYVGWALTRYSNDQIKFEVYPFSGTGVKIIVPSVYDGQWHHLAFNAEINSSSSLTGTVYLDGQYYASATGRTTTMGNTSPLAINHSTQSGYKDEIMLYSGKNVSYNSINSHYTNGNWLYNTYSALDGRLISFQFGGLNDNINFNVNSYTYSGSTANFNVDSTYFLSLNSTLAISNYKPYTGSSVLGSALTVTGIDGNGVGFTASGASLNAASATSASSGNGFYGLATVISSDPVIKNLSAISSPVVGIAVASDIFKVFITNFDYTIKKRFKMTDYVDMNIEFTEI